MSGRTIGAVLVVLGALGCQGPRHRRRDHRSDRGPLDNKSALAKGDR